MTRTRVAVIGAGIAGLGAARALVAASADVDVTVYEAASRPGGHVYTVAVDASTAVDMGFIVCNRERYPLFFQLLRELGVATRPTTMAFSVSLPAIGLEWGSANLSAMFADRRRLVDARHWRLLAHAMTFLHRAARDLDAGRVGERSVDEYLTATRTSRELRDGFVVPLAAALWSLAPERCGAFPAETMLRFLDQHGMLRIVRPLAWHTVVGGSRRYVDALVAALDATGRCRLEVSSPVAQLHRDARGVTLVVAGTEHHFDHVVVATHADTALGLLATPTPDERAILGAFRYSTNRTTLHTDRSFLPRRAAAHAAWNYVGDVDTARVSVTYSMTKLQGLPDRPYLVTLNPRREPACILHDVTFTHPQLDRAALVAQRALIGLAAPRTVYAGAHFGFGFHEDGLRAGIAAAARVLTELRERRE